MGRPAFHVWAGVDDTDPKGLHELVDRFQKKHRLRTKYAALTDMLLLADAMGGTARNRGGGAAPRTDVGRAGAAGLRVDEGQTRAVRGYVDEEWQDELLGEQSPSS